MVRDGPQGVPEQSSSPIKNKTTSRCVAAVVCDQAAEGRQTTGLLRGVALCLSPAIIVKLGAGFGVCLTAGIFFKTRPCQGCVLKISFAESKAQPSSGGNGVKLA